MTEGEQKDRLKEYSKRYRFWANQALTQLGYSINLFTTLGIAFLTFLINKRTDFNEINIDFSNGIDYSLTFFMLAFGFAGLTVFLGLLSVTARLYDIRITRHIIWTRKRTMKKLRSFLPDGFIDLTKDSKLRNYFRTLTKKIKWIQPEDFKDKDKLKQKFDALRKQAKLLGALSWRAHKLQLLTLLISLICYGLT